MSDTFLVVKKPAKDGIAVTDVEDGLEAACKAYPDLNLETMDVEGDKTWVLDLDDQNAMYIVTKVTSPT